MAAYRVECCEHLRVLLLHPEVLYPMGELADELRSREGLQWLQGRSLLKLGVMLRTAKSLASLDERWRQ